MTDRDQAVPPAMSSGDDHSGHNHSQGSHGHLAGVNERRVGLAALIIGSFMFIEAGGAVISGSLALLADAVHMLTDFVALALAWLGFRLSRRPADWSRSYGYDRFQILIAFANGIALFVIAAWIVLEAYHRIQDPVQVMGGVMSIIAAIGLLINVLAFAVLMGADRKNLNIRGAALHVLGDLLGSIAALVAGLVIVTTGWMPIDPILSVFVALIILKSAWSIVRDTAHILLEGTPKGLDPRHVSTELVRKVDGLENIHHVHIWSITQERAVATLHARIDERADASDVTRQIKEVMKTDFDIGHTTVEVERQVCVDTLSEPRETDGGTLPKPGALA